MVYFQGQATWRMGDSCHKAHPHRSVEAEVFIRRERGREQRDQGRELESSPGADKHSPFQLANDVQCASSWANHPGFSSSWLRVILAPCSKVSKSPRAGMLEGQSLYPLNLVLRILIQTCCSSTSYTLVRISTY